MKYIVHPKISEKLSKAGMSDSAICMFIGMTQEQLTKYRETGVCDDQNDEVGEESKEWERELTNHIDGRIF